MSKQRAMHASYNAGVPATVTLGANKTLIGSSTRAGKFGLNAHTLSGSGGAGIGYDATSGSNVSNLIAAFGARIMRDNPGWSTLDQGSGRNWGQAASLRYLDCVTTNPLNGIETYTLLGRGNYNATTPGIAYNTDAERAAAHNNPLWRDAFVAYCNDAITHVRNIDATAVRFSLTNEVWTPSGGTTEATALYNMVANVVPRIKAVHPSVQIYGTSPLEPYSIPTAWRAFLGALSATPTLLNGIDVHHYFNNHVTPESQYARIVSLSNDLVTYGGLSPTIPLVLSECGYWNGVWQGSGGSGTAATEAEAAEGMAIYPFVLRCAPLDAIIFFELYNYTDTRQFLDTIDGREANYGVLYRSLADKLQAPPLRRALTNLKDSTYGKYYLDGSDYATKFGVGVSDRLAIWRANGSGSGTLDVVVQSDRFGSMIVEDIATGIPTTVPLVLGQQRVTISTLRTSKVLRPAGSEDLSLPEYP